MSADPATWRPTPGSLQTGAAALREALRARPSVTAFCHENPDGDTIGAAIAIALAAQQLGCASEVVTADGIPPAYRDLAAPVAVHPTPQLAPGLAVICDAATLARIGPVAESCRDWLAAATIVNVDHHVTNDGFGAIQLVDPEAAASCEVVSAVLGDLGVELNRPIASALLAGIIRDSHGFSSETTRPATLRAAADAVEAGAAIEPIYRAALLDMEPGAIDLWGRLLARLQRSSDGRLVHTVLLAGDLEWSGAGQHDAEGLVEFLMRERGVEIGLLFREVAAGTRVSFRTGPTVDAASLAGAFGGGGHARRAGCVIEGSTEAALRDVLDECRRTLG